MIKRDGDTVTVELSMEQHQSLLLAVGSAIGTALANRDIVLLEIFRELIREVTEIKRGAE